MDLKILGCHGGETPKHRTTSFMVDDRLCIDAGAITGTLSLEEQNRIEAVLVSHAHLDHVRDLATLADNRCQQGGPSLRVVGTAATLAALKKHFFNDKMWPDFSRIRTRRGATVKYQKIRPGSVSKVIGYQVRPILVNHTIETAAFVIESKDGAIACSGDTGPTDRLWKVLNKQDNLRALLMDVSFPNEQGRLAKTSGHHTPKSLAKELDKLENHADLPILLHHIKPVFYKKVTKQLAAIKRRNLTILQLEDQFLF